MALDFTAIWESAGAGKEEERTASGNGTAEKEKPATELYNSPGGADTEEHTRQIYATYQQNIKRAGELIPSIQKGIASGEPAPALLLKALECISLMTGDKVLYSQGKKDLLAIYGWGLREPATLEAELEETRNRLAMLTRPELSTAGLMPEEQQNIQRAVTAHRERIDRLERELKTGK